MEVPFNTAGCEGQHAATTGKAMVSAHNTVIKEKPPPGSEIY